MSDIDTKVAESRARAGFDAWPGALQALFDGTALETKASFTASLLASDGDARIRSALLSVGELFAPDARTLVFALWPASRAARAIRCTGRATLTFVFDEAFYQVHLAARPAACSDSPLTHFIATIESGESQRVAYALLTSGITVELQCRDTVMVRWHEQIRILKQVAGMSG